jgi:hypothetical protein
MRRKDWWQPIIGCARLRCIYKEVMQFNIGGWRWSVRPPIAKAQAGAADPNANNCMILLNSAVAKIATTQSSVSACGTELFGLFCRIIANKTINRFRLFPPKKWHPFA